MKQHWENSIMECCYWSTSSPKFTTHKHLNLGVLHSYYSVHLFRLCPDCVQNCLFYTDELISCLALINWGNNLRFQIQAWQNKSVAQVINMSLSYMFIVNAKMLKNLVFAMKRACTSHPSYLSSLHKVGGKHIYSSAPRFPWKLLHTRETAFQQRHRHFCVLFYLCDTQGCTSYLLRITWLICCERKPSKSAISRFVWEAYHITWKLIHSRRQWGYFIGIKQQWSSF